MLPNNIVGLINLMILDRIGNIAKKKTIPFSQKIEKKKILKDFCYWVNNNYTEC